MNGNNPKDDAGKPKLSLVPTQITRDIAEVREYGVKKYGDNENWKRVEKQRYVDALYRHFLSYLDDPDGVDSESGIKHYKHMACNMAFICELENGSRFIIDNEDERKVAYFKSKEDVADYIESAEDIFRKGR